MHEYLLIALNPKLATLQEINMRLRHGPAVIRSHSPITALLRPYFRHIAFKRPIQRPHIMIANNQIAVFDLQKFINALQNVRIPIANITHHDQAIFLIIELTISPVRWL